MTFNQFKAAALLGFLVVVGASTVAMAATTKPSVKKPSAAAATSKASSKASFLDLELEFSTAYDPFLGDVSLVVAEVASENSSTVSGSLPDADTTPREAFVASQTLTAADAGTTKSVTPLPKKEEQLTDIQELKKVFQSDPAAFRRQEFSDPKVEVVTISHTPLPAATTARATNATAPTKPETVTVNGAVTTVSQSAAAAAAAADGNDRPVQLTDSPTVAAVAVPNRFRQALEKPLTTAQITGVLLVFASIFGMLSLLVIVRRRRELRRTATTLRKVHKPKQSLTETSTLDYSSIISANSEDAAKTLD